ncbi:unnamed protein product [Peniophora sp. CBMAI 1063]|nr:unnamed protein product [Peniophora sp. CBMAI 1063]
MVPHIRQDSRANVTSFGLGLGRRDAAAAVALDPERRRRGRLWVISELIQTTLDWLSAIPVSHSLHLRACRTPCSKMNVSDSGCFKTPVDMILPSRAYDLGVSLRVRFRERGDLTDLENAIMFSYLSVELTAEVHMNKPERLFELGAALRDRFRCYGWLADIDRAIIAMERAVELSPDEHPPKPGILRGLGLILSERYQRTRRVDDLELSIAAVQRAVELTAEDDSPEKASRLHDLGCYLTIRFQLLLELDDLERSIAVGRQAVELTPEGYFAKTERLHSLAVSLSYRFEHLGELDDLEQSISIMRQVVDLTPEEHPYMLTRYKHLSTSLIERFRRLREWVDLEHAVQVMRIAIRLMPEGQPRDAAQLQTLGVSLITRFQRFRVPEDLEESLSAIRSALEFTVGDDPEKAGRLSSLSHALLGRFLYFGELDDLERSVSTARQAVDLTMEEHPDGVNRLYNLGCALEARLEREPNKANFDAALDCYMKGTSRTVGGPAGRWQMAIQFVKFLTKDHGRKYGSAELLLLAHSRVMDILPEIVWFGHSIGRRYQECAKISHVVSAAVCTAIQNEVLPQAIEWLEAGRAFIWFQLLSLRMPLDDLKEQHPGLAESLESVSRALQRAEHASLHSSATDSPAFVHDSNQDAADKRRQLVIRYDQKLRDIRRCPGFEDFMRPPKIRNLLPALQHTDGSVVFVNVNTSSCDALVLFSDSSMTRIELPQLTEKRAVQLRTLWVRNLERSDTRMRRAMAPESFAARGATSVFGQILARLWTWVVQPILERLNVLKREADDLPHITWCPTGPLTQLPLHAAGVYNVEEGHRLHAFDFVVSSYTPSLSVLLQNHHGASGRHIASQPNLLMIAQPDTPGLSPLPGTTKECARVRAALPHTTCTLLQHDEAVVARTLQVMNQYPWVHLACHGRQDTTDLTQSAFALYDGRLTLSALMKTVADNAELAFLSACQTAVGDEKIPEESAHLAAGMLVAGFKGVIATMWSIGDEDAPVVAEAYYKKLLELRSSGAVKAGTGAAYALHEAVKVLREKVGEEKVVKWAPFVHFGV